MTNTELRGRFSPADIPDLTGRTILITGGNRGLGGDYLGPAQLSGIRGPVRRCTPSASARTASLAAQLWDASVDMTGAAITL